MTDIVESARYQLGLDSAEYNRSAQSVAATNMQLVASLEGVATAEEHVVQQTYRNDDAFAKLEGRYDRTIALEQRRRNALEQTARVAEEAGISGDRLAAQISRVNARFNEQVTALGRSRGPLQAGAGAMARYGTVVQQAGYQFGDFAVQVASGQSAMVAFTQQGSQLAGFLGGPWGAVVGAAIGTLGALAINFLDLGAATREAEERQKSFATTLTKTYDIIDSVGSKFEATKAAQLSSARNDLLSAIKEQEALVASMTTIGGRVGRYEDTGLGAARAELARMKSEFEALSDMIRTAGRGQGWGAEFAGAGDTPATKPSGVSSPTTARRVADTKAIEEQSSALTELMRVAANENELLSATGAQLEALQRERAIQAATTQAQAAAQRDYNAGLRDSPILMQEELTQIQKITAANYDLAHAQEVRGKVAVEANEETTKSQEVLNGFLDQTVDRIGSGLTQAFATGQTEAARLGDIGRAVLSELLQLALHLSVINPFKNWALGQNNPTAEDAMGGIVGWLGSLFGSSSSGVNGMGVPFGHAAGGPVSRGDMYMVGEKGPELFVSDRAGSIVPNHDLSFRPTARESSGGGRSYVMNNNITIQGGSGKPEENRDLIDQMKEQLERSMQDFVRRTIVDETRGGGELNKSAMTF